MKQFNGTDYDILQPKTIASQIPDVYSKTDTITAETLSQLGLSANKLPNDAFQQIKTLINNAQSSADSKARIQMGSYVGTGTYGKNNPCSLTFDFVPKVFILSNNYSETVILYNQTYASNAYSSSYGLVEINLTWNNNQVSWYATVNSGLESYGPNKQANVSGATYRYCIIG